MNLAKFLVPDVHIGIFEVQTLRLARHVGCANDGEGVTVKLEIVLVDREPRAGAQVGFVANPEAGVIDGANLVSLQKLCLEQEESLAGGRREHDRL